MKLNRKKIIFAPSLLLIVLVLSFQTTVVNAQGENLANAIILTEGVTQAGTFPDPNHAGYSNWYNITLSNGDYKFNLTGESGTDFDFILYNSTGDYIDEADEVYYPDLLLMPNLGADEYSIYVYSPFFETGDYNFTVTSYSPTAGESWRYPKTISLGVTSGDSLLGPAPDGSFWYRITITTLNNYEFNLSGPGGTDFGMVVFDSAINFISGTPPGLGYPVTCRGYSLPAADYFINVVNNTSNLDTGFFDVSIAVYTRVPGDNTDNVIPISLGETVGDLPGPGAAREIWYGITLIAGDHELSLTGPGGTNFALFVINSTGLIGQAAGPTYPAILTAPGLTAGDYMIGIIPYSGTGGFTLDVTGPVDITSPTATTYSTSTITVTLSSGAAHYWYYIAGVDSTNYTWTEPVDRTLDNGIYTLHAYGNDTAGNEAHVNVTFNVDDTTPPNINIVSPLATTYSTSTITVTLSGDATHYWYYITGDTDNSTWTSPSVVRTLADGTYTLHAYGNDTAGNIDHASVTFTIDTTPTDTTTEPSDTSGTSESSDTDGDGLTPGFSFMVILVVMMLGAIIVVRRRRIKRML